MRVRVSMCVCVGGGGGALVLYACLIVCVCACLVWLSMFLCFVMHYVLHFGEIVHKTVHYSYIIVYVDIPFCTLFLYYCLCGYPFLYIIPVLLFMWISLFNDAHFMLTKTVLETFLDGNSTGSTDSLSEKVLKHHILICKLDPVSKPAGTSTLPGVTTIL